MMKSMKPQKYIIAPQSTIQYSMVVIGDGRPSNNMALRVIHGALCLIAVHLLIMIIECCIIFYGANIAP